MNLVRTISTSISDVKGRIVKFLRYGLDDVQTSDEISPYGLDSNPIAGMIAIYAKTEEKGATVIIGYILENQKALPGEFRTYSTDKDGVEKFYTWLKNDGTYEVGGNDDFLVRYNELAAGFNQLKSDFNTFAAAYTPGSPSTVGTPPTVLQSTASIAGAKISKIKTGSSL